MELLCLVIRKTGREKELTKVTMLALNIDMILEKNNIEGYSAVKRYAERSTRLMSML